MNDGTLFERLAIPAATLVVNAAVTYGVISTQLQWIRADLERQQRQIERIEARLWNDARKESREKLPTDHRRVAAHWMRQFEVSVVGQLHDRQPGRRPAPDK